MPYNTIKHVLPLFSFRGKYKTAEEIHSGNINNTYHLVYTEGRKEFHYTLQHINTYVFKDPCAVMQNIAMVTNHLKESYQKDGISFDRRVLELVYTRDGESFYLDKDGDYWRAYVYINHATAHDYVKKPEHFFETGRAFGEFQKRLADFPAHDLTETIPGFHNTTKRFYAFVRSIDVDKANRVRDLDDEIEFFFQRRKMMGAIVKPLESGVLPLRATHNDTKINNVMIDDKTDKALCVIDLDTVMPGSSLYDYGDAIRFGASTAAEDEPKTEKISLDLEKFTLFTRGYLSETNGFLKPEELQLLPLGVKVITCELAMRFLTDYMDGDPYFRVRSPDHNLIRARAQMKLLTDIERKEDEMQSIVERIIKEKQ
ncbi:MAG: phosphotransferase enzyme family protein [Christensenellales bacterium]|jgi:Ser/Thr protein kinase RdoA (MazF antagonist)